MNFNSRTHLSKLERPENDGVVLEADFVRYHKPAAVQDISAVVFDWDGTFQPSYNTLPAVDVFRATLERHVAPDVADKFVNDLVKLRTFQGVLHGRGMTHSFFESFVRDHDLEFSADIIASTMEAVTEFHKQAFRKYPGVDRVLELLQQTGTPAFIYTNSSDYDLLKRMHVAECNPADFVAIYAKDSTTCDRPPLSAAMKKVEWATAKSFTERVISYKDYKKPSTQPLRDIAHILDIRPDQILVVGEGRNDAVVAHEFGARFAFQAEGARDICDRVQRMNEMLRPGSEPLGYDNVVFALSEMRMRSCDLVLLNKGLPEMCQMIETGAIRNHRPLHRAVVRGGRLVPDGDK